MFVLIVDDISIEYVGCRHANHLLNTLKRDYMVKCDWGGTKFAGIDHVWDYTKRTCHLSMKGHYIQELHVKYGHATPAKPQHALLDRNTALTVCIRYVSYSCSLPVNRE
jgi:hypothetical protein